MSDSKRQMYPPAGTYQANSPVVTHQAIPYVATHQANPPVGIYQAPPAAYTVAVTVPQQPFEAFDRKKVKVFSIILIVFGCLPLIINLISLNIPGVAANVVPIVAGILGILSSQNPSRVKIVLFMVISIITIIISIICALIMALFIIWGNYIQSVFEYDATVDPGTIVIIFGILGVIFSVIQTAISIYCSILASRQVGCCGCSQNQESGGVVHGQVHQSAANVGQYQQYQLSASNPPPYSYAIQQQ